MGPEQPGLHAPRASRVTSRVPTRGHYMQAREKVLYAHWSAWGLWRIHTRVCGGFCPGVYGGCFHPRAGLLWNIKGELPFRQLLLPVQWTKAPRAFCTHVDALGLTAHSRRLLRVYTGAYASLWLASDAQMYFHCLCFSLDS